MAVKIRHATIEFRHLYYDIFFVLESKVLFATLEFNHNYHDIKPYGQARIMGASVEFVRRAEKTDFVI